MQNNWSHLLLVFGLAAPLVTATPMETAAMNSFTPTTLATMVPAVPSTTQSLDNIESFWDQIPTTSPTLSVISDYKVPTPTPGSFGILNGIPFRLLNDTVPENRPILADTANAENKTTETSEPTNFHQPWNTSYPGPIHDGDWFKYLQIWDPVWWSLNLDSLRQTSCICSAEDYYSNPQAQLAAYSNFEFYSHTLGSLYSLDWICGPVPSSMGITERIKGKKYYKEHCWSMAGGEFPDDHNALDMKDYYWCDDKEEFCVKPWRDNERWLEFNGHKRKYDRKGVHTWSEIQQVVKDVCEPVCEDKFRMKFDDFSRHNPSFITTFYPPKPIDLTIAGD